MLIILLTISLPIAWATEPFEGPQACGAGEQLAPVSITMSSTFTRKKCKNDGCIAEHCNDGDPATVCRTDKEALPFIVLDFGQTVEVSKVLLIPNGKWTVSVEESKVFISNETATAGMEFKGVAISDNDSTRAYRGRYVVIQRMTGSVGMTLSDVIVCSGYFPGTPGGPWTEEEVTIVKEKVKAMMDPANRNTLYSEHSRFPAIVNLVYGRARKPTGPKSKNYWYNASYSRADVHLAPSTRKLIQLAFHDCLKNVDDEGRAIGGCDGCLNWKNMDFMNDVPKGHASEAYKMWPSYRNETIKKRTDNNKLSTTVFALEWLYTDPTWPPQAPNLPVSLVKSGKSRADLWQLAANTALEIEMAKANYGCSHKVSFQQMLVALEGRENCLWKLHKPIPFQHGRADCVPDVKKATTTFPFEATNTELHSNPFGQADGVMKDMKRDFGMTARQSIALMAVHGIAIEHHNKVLETQYKWAGSPFLSNLYYKTLARRPQYDLGAGLRLSAGGQFEGPGRGRGVLRGDKFGRPLSREVQGDFQMSMRNWWNTTSLDAGPWFFRPLTVHTAHSLEDDLRPRRQCFEWNYQTQAFDRLAVHGCDTATIDEETGVQFGGPSYSQARGKSFVFYLPYEMNFVLNFTVDSENHPQGCNFEEIMTVYRISFKSRSIAGRMPINCTRSSYKLDDEDETWADIVDVYADNHETWGREFLEGWQVIQRNGYGDTLTDGPEASWLGYSLLPPGTEVSFPLLFTEELSFSLYPFLGKDQCTNKTSNKE